MPGILLAPVHAGLLRTQIDLQVAGPPVDFAKLPWTDGHRDFNASTPYLALDVLNPPFYPGAFVLRQGVHLHWYLPSVYRRGFISSSGNTHVHPPAPNFWIVRRYQGGQTADEWVVESDVIAPPSQPEHASGSYMPYQQPGTPPYRMIGRTLPLHQWLNEATVPKRYPNLTAMGYGDPTFSSYYPACSRCFGFHDPDGLNFQTPVTYEVIGWRREPGHALFHWIIANTRLAGRPGKSSASSLLSSIGWQTADAPPLDPSMDVVLCYSRVVLDPKPVAAVANGGNIAIGADTNAALAAHVSAKVKRTVVTSLTQEQIEEQLDHVGTLPDTRTAKSDRYFKMIEARHRDSFVAVPGGVLWTIRNERASGAANAKRSARTVAQDIPAALVRRLQRVNQLQAEYENAGDDIASLQEQLFCDWHQYQRAMYSEPVSAVSGQADEIKAFVEKNTLVQLFAARQNAGEIAFDLSGNQALQQVKLTAGAAGCRADLLSTSLTELLRNLSIFNATCISGTLIGDVAMKIDSGMKGYLQIGPAGGRVDLDHLNGLGDSMLRADHPLSDFTLRFWLKLAKGEGGICFSFDAGHWFEVEVPRTGTDEGRVIFSTSDVLGQPNVLKSETAIAPDQWQHITLTYSTASGKKSINNADSKLTLLERPNALLPVGGRQSRKGYLGVSTFVPQFEDNQAVRGEFAGALTGLTITVGKSEPVLPSGILELEFKPMLSLHRGAAPRYWQPKEPVIAFTGGDALSRDSVQTEGHYPHDSLKCSYVPQIPPEPFFVRSRRLNPLLMTLLSQIRTHLDSLEATAVAGNPGFSRADGNPWRPILAEWEVGLHPLAISDLHAGRSDRYSSDFITDAYGLSREAIELELAPGKQSLGRTVNFLTGRSLVNPNGAAAMLERLDSFIQSKGGKVQPELTASRSVLEEEKAGTLTISLNGLRAALLQKQQIMQLPVDDPLAFEDYRQFAKTVQKEVGRHRTMAPDPALSFTPIQSGALELRKLRLIDSFGQSRNQAVGAVDLSAKLAAAGQPALMSLPVRLAQPARVDFRWLQASDRTQDALEYKGASPVCGWLTYNDLDDLILVHDAQGFPVGALVHDSDPLWQPGPGMEKPIAPAMFSDPALRRVVEYLIRKGAGFIRQFGQTLENSLEAIHPEDFGGDEWVLMSGRPLAVLRVKVNLRLKGLATCDQSAAAFYRDLHTGKRDSCGFEDVNFPVRIGDHRRLNDGLIGYWEETDGQLGDQFHAPKNGSGDPPLVNLSIREPARILTLLMEPRGHLQATSGILPAKAITLPAPFYRPALSRMRPAFFTGPVITPPEKLHVPLPLHDGLRWDWLERRRDEWRRTDQSDIGQPAAAAGLPRQEVREGWLELQMQNHNDHTGETNNA